MSLEAWACLTIGAPLVTFFAMLLGLRRWPAATVALSIATATLACIGTWMLALGLGAGQVYDIYVPWAATPDFTVHFGFRLAGLSTAMGVVVGTIHLLVQLYSVGYMAHDPGKARYFGIMSLFATAMLVVVLAADLAQTFIAWELVGVSSYLLIGFWGHKPEAAQAAKKAFVMTRFGDVGLFIGLVLLLLHLPVEAGQPRGLLISSVLGAVTDGTLQGQLPYGIDLVTGIGLLLFCGIVGKSAQFPLHTWLPDAMEGPTPVSSLLHSATMVAAGVYLFALLQPLFLASQVTSTVALSIATGTALLSAGVAMVVLDMKRVLAWSSISQLSFMLMGLAAGSQIAGFFHLVTHAGFKCLLFLTAGILIHLAHSGDMEVMGKKVGSASRAATLGLLVGAASLAGVPALAGFMSKEVVLGTLHHHAGFEGFYALALLGSAMTAYYATRMVCLVLRPAGVTAEEREDPEIDEAHEGPLRIMAGIVVVLAITTLGLGWVGPEIAGHLGGAEDVVTIHWTSPGVGLAMVALALGVGLAWRDFGAEGAARVGFLRQVPGVEHMLLNGWYVDRFWRWVSDRLVDSFIALSLLIDRSWVDQSVDSVGLGTRQTGLWAATLQNGRLQVYLSASLALLAVGLLLLTRM